MPVEETGKRSVLVVEDEDNIALALDYLLSRENYKHDRVANGGEALLLDVMLPEMSGYEICQAIRLDQDLAGVKILMMTARGSAIERKKGLALGADGFISKPFELTELRSEVRRLLEE
jgi:two-component system, OmpR family, phosphate regulon response regulator PhoB